MRRNQGCRALEARLELLLERAGAVKRSLRVVMDERPEPLHDHLLARSFGDAAGCVAEALRDISERLCRLEEILNALSGDSLEAMEP